MRKTINLANALCLMAAGLVAVPVNSQLRPRPNLTAIQVTPTIKLAPRCEIVSVWDNIKKQYRNVENGRVVFKMNVTGDAAGLVAERSSDNSSKPVVNGQDTPSIEPGAEILDFKLANGAPINTGMVVETQSLAVLQPGPISYAWNWPTGLALLKNYRWATNHCNNVPVPPLVKGEKPVLINPKLTPIPADPTSGGTATNATGTGSETKTPQ